MHSSCLLPAAASPRQPVIRPSQLNSKSNYTHTQHHPHKRLVLCAAASSSKAAVGIDLGTTNSVVAVLREGEAYPKVIHDSSSGTFTVPSVVSYDAAAGMPLVGAQARQQAAANPSNTFYSVKRLMGRSWAQIPDAMALAYKVQQAQGGGLELVCPAQGTTLTPQQVRIRQVTGSICFDLMLKCVRA